MKKKKLLFDIAMILLMGIMLIGVRYFHLDNYYTMFGLIPLLVFYHLGGLSVKLFGMGYGFEDKSSRVASDKK